jgi:hypothetical protein
MREEKVTISILKWLEKNAWEIISYDFPQSGTGILLHKNSLSGYHKNKGGIIPDIIARKSNKVVYFENKDRYYADDFTKIEDLKVKNEYTDALTNLLGSLTQISIYFGIGIPALPTEIKKCLSSSEKIDFLISVKDNYSIEINLGSEIFD